MITGYDIHNAMHRAYGLSPSPDMDARPEFQRARGSHQGRLATVMTSLRVAIATRLIATGEYLRQAPAPHPEAVAEPADTAVTV